MTSRSIPQNISKSDNNLNANQKEDSDLANIDNSDLYLFLQFYFKRHNLALKHMARIKGKKINCQNLLLKQ